MLNAPKPERLETAEDYMALGAYWTGYAQDHAEGWGAACSAYETAAQKFDAAGNAEEAEWARVHSRSAAASMSNEKRPPTRIVDGRSTRRGAGRGGVLTAEEMREVHAAQIGAPSTPHPTPAAMAVLWDDLAAESPRHGYAAGITAERARLAAHLRVRAKQEAFNGATALLDLARELEA